MPRHSDYQPKHLHKMTPGWLFPYLVDGDRVFGVNRWAYWDEALDTYRVPTDPIPYIDFDEQPDREAVKNVKDCLDYATRYDGIRHSDAFEAFVAWMLHGFGDPVFSGLTADHLPDRRVSPLVLDYWYETFKLGLLQLHPTDYMAFFAQGGANHDYNPYHGSGFFATPMSVCKMMAGMMFTGDPDEMKRQSVCDPACGTGSLLLAASNYSLNIYGQDISSSMVRCTKLNMWLYAPWGVFWPNLSRWGGPDAVQLKRLLFESVPVMLVAPEPEPLFAPVAENVMRGELKQTDTGQYVLPLFDELIEV
ncbi:MAG TPA: N-6 DNA methylase [Aggregatilinea sp.]|uniref:N-6 DNA methylase n=1 Tax=Aggregatilinea sp. TaxID=2806333 RepID=UPI002BAD8E06|nr:N-6 DNA methylase [Aggregatilinea sp.]HML21841.1 N-6 DNA methylase [Aggregatilinea sp.]